MKNAKLLVSIVSLFALPILSLDAAARSVRLDSGAWDLSGFLSSDSTESIGFNVDILGVNASSATILANGGLQLSGGGESAELNAFLDPSQSAGGNSVQYQFGVTNGTFNQAGVDAGFRVSWQVFDSVGALQNEYQLALFALTGGQIAMEFNYNQILLGSDASGIGFENSLGDMFDLAAGLGLGFSDLMGVGDDVVVSNCPATPNALACNNFYYNSLAFGPDASILPNLANGYFNQIDANGGIVQGRYLFVFGDAAAVPEPTPLALVAIGLLALYAGHRMRRQARR